MVDHEIRRGQEVAAQRRRLRGADDVVQELPPRLVEGSAPVAVDFDVRHEELVVADVYL